VSLHAEENRERLREIVIEAGVAPLSDTEANQFSLFLEHFLRWNERINLSAIRDVEGILQRHFLESIYCARALPAAISTLLDYGSGGGFPGIPIAILNPQIAITLAESQNKKAAFLNESLRLLGLNARVHSSRAELIQEKFDGVTLRAVDRMAEAVHAATQLLNPEGWLILMTTEADAASLTCAAGETFEWSAPKLLPGAEQKQILIGRRLSH
jgi:16S rRNA (guanine527-N7)-methyltransferase